MPEVLYLSRGDVERLRLPMGEVVAAVEEGFRLKGTGETEMPPKPALHPGGGAFIHAMPALVRGEVGLAALKWVAVYNTNPARGLPALAALLVLSDAADGQPLAVMDAALLTALRTGASVGVAARRLARDDVEAVGDRGVRRAGANEPCRARRGAAPPVARCAATTCRRRRSGRSSTR